MITISALRKVQGTLRFTTIQPEEELQARYSIYVDDALVFDGSAFVYPYEGSERISIQGGWSFKLRSHAGWSDNPQVVTFGPVLTEEIVTDTLSVGSAFSVDGTSDLFGELTLEGGILLKTHMPTGVVPTGEMRIGTDGNDLIIRVGSTNYKLTKVAV